MASSTLALFTATKARTQRFCVKPFWNRVDKKEEKEEEEEEEHV